MSGGIEFGQYFWQYISRFSWFEGLLFISIVSIIYILGKDFWKKMFFETIKKFKKQKRSCGDCILIMFGKSEEHKTQVTKKRKSILENQMLFFEQKMEGLILELLRTYLQEIEKRRENKENPDYVRENKEYVLYQEMLLNAMQLVKLETRRSFRENNFPVLHSKEFSDYCKKKTHDLISIAQTYLLNRYPKNNMIVPLSYRFESLDIPAIEDMVFEVYINAKEIKKTTDEEIKQLDINFKKDIDNLIKTHK